MWSRSRKNVPIVITCLIRCGEPILDLCHTLKNPTMCALFLKNKRDTHILKVSITFYIKTRVTKIGSLLASLKHLFSIRIRKQKHNQWWICPQNVTISEMAYIVRGMMYEPDTYFEGKMEAQVSIFRYTYLQAQKWKKRSRNLWCGFSKMQIWSFETGNR